MPEPHMETVRSSGLEISPARLLGADAFVPVVRRFEYVIVSDAGNRAGAAGAARAVPVGLFVVPQRGPARYEPLDETPPGKIAAQVGDLEARLSARLAEQGRTLPEQAGAAIARLRESWLTSEGAER